MIAVKDVYSPDEMLAIHLTQGWSNYIWSVAHSRQMQAAQAKVVDATYAAHVKALSKANAS